MSSIIVKVNDTNTIINEYTVDTDDRQPITIQSVGKVNYELMDSTSGLAPQHIMAKRVEQDLELTLSNFNPFPDVIIKGFYDNADSALIGKAENGDYYYFVPDSADINDFVTELPDGRLQGQALGGQPQPSPWWAGQVIDGGIEAGFSAIPWLATIIGLGIFGVTVAAIIEDSDDDKDDKQPQTVTDTDNTSDESNLLQESDEVVIPNNSNVTNTSDDEVIVNNSNLVAAEEDSSLEESSSQQSDDEVVIQSPDMTSPDKIVANTESDIESDIESGIASENSDKNESAEIVISDNINVVELNPTDLTDSDSAFKVSVSDMIDQGTDVIYINGGVDSKVNLIDSNNSGEQSSWQQVDVLDRDDDGVVDYNLWVDSQDMSRKVYIDVDIIEDNIF